MNESSMASRILRQPVGPVTRRRHLLDLNDLSLEEINHIFQTTDAMKEVLGRPIKRVPALRGKTIVNLFYEASTRTRVSFELAGKNLSADVVNITASGSSVEKGESLVDTIRTLEALGADIVVIRHSQSGAPQLISQHVEGSVINAGDGWHAHPTQALLDAYTIREKLGSVTGKKIVIVGDILHSRVARSNIWGLTLLGARVVLCGPPTLLPLGFAPGDGHAPGGVRDGFSMPQVEIDYNLDSAIDGADVVMALRMQKERQEKGLLPSIREYAILYQVNRSRMARAKPGALVMHPGPMNEGVEISPDMVHSANSVIETQVTNGVAVRMALLFLLAGENNE